MAPMITIPAAAKRVGITRQALARAAREGRLKATLVGYEYVVLESELVKFITKRNKGLPSK